MIPSGTDYPEALDTDNNLFVVHDSVRMRLTEDYNIGDTQISVDGDVFMFARMPPTGLITLTEQCSEIDSRAISFYYSGFSEADKTITGLELLPEFTDSKKPKRITNMVLNVFDRHHESVKNALMAVQEFAGVKGTEDTQPFGETLEGRINFLRRLVLQPKAWFTSDKQRGNVPLEIEFNDQSFRLGTDGTGGEVTVTWDFGDQTASVISTISATSVVSDSDVDVLVIDTDQGKIKKVYHQPGLYDVKMTVENDFGQDVVIFPKYINARVKAPNAAIVRYIENSASQEVTPGVPPNGPFTTVPKIRSSINSLIQIEVEEGENPSNLGYSFGGEPLNGDDDPIDPIVSYTWALGDDLQHPNSRLTTASYSVGGIYDMKLRVDTQFGAFRITNYNESIDIVENKNLWLWTFQTSNTARAYEYGLISETFKLTDAAPLTVNRNDSFLTGLPDEAKQKSEFKRNTGFAPRSNIGSGQNGTALLYWSSGRNALDPITSESVNVVEYNGFAGTYVTRPSFQRAWNWAGLHSPSASYFILGTVDDYPPNTSPTNDTKQTLNLSTLAVTSGSISSGNYLNNAQELKENVAVYDNAGDSVYGHYSVLRTAWKDSTGYILRNNGVGPFFRLKSFYRTEGTVSAPFTNIRKMQDIQGPTKLEGQLVDLSTGIYFLNNSGSVSLFSLEDEVWRTGGPGVNSLLYRNLQDTSVTSFDALTNTLLAASDSDKRAYLSFDYSVNAFLKFSEIDLTFTTLGSRPDGEQWIIGAF